MKEKKPLITTERCYACCQENCKFRFPRCQCECHKRVSNLDEKSASRYDGTLWIEVKKFVDDPQKSWKERYEALERHHRAETKFLLSELRKLDLELQARVLEG